MFRSLSSRALLLFAAIVVLVTTRAVVSFWLIGNERDLSEQLERASALSVILETSYVDFLEAQESLALIPATTDVAIAEAFHGALSDAVQGISEANRIRLAAGDEMKSGEARDLASRLRTFESQTELLVRKAMQPSSYADEVAADSAIEEMAVEAKALRESMHTMALDSYAEVSELHAAIDKSKEISYWLAAAGSGLALAGAFVIAVMFMLWVVRPLSSLRRFAKDIAEGTSWGRADVHGPEDVSSLADEFNHMLDARERAERVAIIQRDLAFKLSASSSLEEAAPACTEAVMELSEADCAGVVLYEQGSDTMRVAHHVGGDVQLVGKVMHIRSARRGDLLCEGKTLHGNSKDLGIEVEGAPLGCLEGLRSVALVPIRNERDLLGCLTVGSVSDEEISPSVRKTVEGVAAQMGGALVRLRVEEDLRRRARLDPLTGALNHAAIIDELHRVISSDEDGRSHAVAMVDVDGLKAINDTYGRQLGHWVLTALARALSVDGAIVGRFGPDEFIVILPGYDRVKAGAYLSRLADTLENTGPLDPVTGASIPIKASSGLAVYPEEADGVEDLISLSENAVLMAKREAKSIGLGGDERASRMVGEIVPLLTSARDLQTKLRLVAHRISLGAGYDGVDFDVSREGNVSGVQSTFLRGVKEIDGKWFDQRRALGDLPLRAMIESGGKPVIIADAETDKRLGDPSRRLLKAAAIRSLVVAPMIWQNRVIGTLSVGSQRENAFGPADAQFLMSVATQVTAIVRTTQLVEDLQHATSRLGEAHAETVMMLAAAAEARDRVTGHHLRNVRFIVEELGRAFGYSDEQIKDLGLASVLHDIGKIRVPDSVLASEGRLTEKEWDLMRHHTVWGEEFLAGRPGFELSAEVARWHHERWDGTGYPDGLASSEIPEGAAIVAVADSFDAMTHDRPYRPGRSPAVAVREIAAHSGTQFSPAVVEKLIELHKSGAIARLRRRAADEDRRLMAA